MSTYYAPDDTKPGDSLHYSSLDSRAWPGQSLKIEVIDECTYSNYSGGTCEQSNYRVLDQDRKASRYLVRISGDHGTQSLGYFPKKDGKAPKPVQEYLEGLANYPLISDDDHSELEHELESKAWEDDGHDDFCKALTSYLDEQDPGFEHDLDIVDGEDFRERIFELWREGVEAFLGGESCRHEDGGSVYFPIRSWFERAPRGTNAQASLLEELTAIARETGYDCEAMQGALTVARDAFLLGDVTLQGSLLETSRIEAYARAQAREAIASEMSVGTA